ncbi:Apoptosis-stimulating of p53 protein 2 [Manis javanica]|nr:Apoptosis-stimulating of p53 protein 2 [Manis javanica]
MLWASMAPTGGGTAGAPFSYNLPVRICVSKDCDVESFRSGMTEEKGCTDSDTESYFSSTSYEEDCPGLCQEWPRLLTCQHVEDCDGRASAAAAVARRAVQAEETVPVAEEETAALSEMASGTSESDVGHTERSSPSPLSGHWAFHLKRSRLRRSEHAEDCDVESFRSGMTEEKDCTGLCLEDELEKVGCIASFLQCDLILRQYGLWRLTRSKEMGGNQQRPSCHYHRSLDQQQSTEEPTQYQQFSAQKSFHVEQSSSWSPPKTQRELPIAADPSPQANVSPPRPPVPCSWQLSEAGLMWRLQHTTNSKGQITQAENNRRQQPSQILEAAPRVDHGPDEGVFPTGR